MTIKKNLKTVESRSFWNSVDEARIAVESMPAWAKAGMTKHTEASVKVNARQLEANKKLQEITAIPVKGHTVIVELERLEQFVQEFMWLRNTYE